VAAAPEVGQTEVVLLAVLIQAVALAEQKTELMLAADQV
jgi:hypothetical protein